ncbi:hypothetical protein DCAR_0727936 [Daucus carota subsp. sativus]|uniref:NB-ARC domain-containing protein n=1 Tax=Daucus carota subsp. sativus TaxID=79200 RepID=A0AAF1B6Z5_DAUCS|nr:hypothetical protein DCAR_0727936 [Daucus carota subsp. sativus]
MADGTVAFALERIRDFLTQQVNIRIGVKDGVRWLKDELGYLQPARESVLCGIGKDIEILKKRITVIKKRRNEYVISIHGMGGLGKTSLATKLYNSNELSHFDTRAKVCVSMDYNIKDVLKRLIKSFMGLEHEKELSKMDEQDLLQHTRKLLQGQGRYIAVIDDIWDIKAWEVIKIAFPNDENGSRIIITTRNKKVAETVDDKFTDLRLVCSDFREDPMPTLGDLPNLTALELDSVYMGKTMVNSHNAFPSLQILRFIDFPELEEWQAEDGAFPSLRSFQKTDCGKLKKIPVQLERFWTED